MLSQTETPNFLSFQDVRQGLDGDGLAFDGSCTWGQYTDGVDNRQVRWDFYRFDGIDGPQRASSKYQEYVYNRGPQYKVADFDQRDVDGFTGPAHVKRLDNGVFDTCEVRLMVVESNRLLVVEFSAQDKFLWWKWPTSHDKTEALANLVAREIIQRNW
ncbi:hypothetical protein [Nocardia sp. NPDC058666]|uniref:hypothetical protein n=1 Tax=Nocardia sp. NPDC058666 TaxID=3346587 RepID=UPI0036541E0C